MSSHRRSRLRRTRFRGRLSQTMEAVGWLGLLAQVPWWIASLFGLELNNRGTLAALPVVVLGMTWAWVAIPAALVASIFLALYRLRGNPVPPSQMVLLAAYITEGLVVAASGAL